jgi:hypothetical protein
VQKVFNTRQTENQMVPATVCTLNSEKLLSPLPPFSRESILEYVVVRAHIAVTIISKLSDIICFQFDKKLHWRNKALRPLRSSYVYPLLFPQPTRCGHVSCAMITKHEMNHHSIFEIDIWKLRRPCLIRSVCAGKHFHYWLCFPVIILRRNEI